MESKPAFAPPSQGGQHQGSSLGPKINPTSLASNLENFARERELVVGERVDHLAANQQQIRAEELRELVERTQEEFFNMLEMVPQT